jgi:hypothetical protein
MFKNLRQGKAVPQDALHDMVEKCSAWYYLKMFHMALSGNVPHGRIENCTEGLRENRVWYETCPEPGLPGRVTFPPALGPAGGGAGGPAPHVAGQKNLRGHGSRGPPGGALISNHRSKSKDWLESM